MFCHMHSLACMKPCQCLSVSKYFIWILFLLFISHLCASWNIYLCYCHNLYLPICPQRCQTVVKTVNLALPFRITPIFTVSCVTGQNLDLILKFLHVLPPQHSHSERERLAQDLTEFQIDELYSVPLVGTVVGGVIRRWDIQHRR